MYLINMLNIKLIDASKIYFKVLKNIYEPEKNENYWQNIY